MHTRRFITSLIKCKCGAKSLLIGSRVGGMVGKVCLECRTKSDHVTPEEIPEVQCDCCGGFLEVVQNVKGEGRNYHYACTGCKKEWKLGSELPLWDELFEIRT